MARIYEMRQKEVINVRDGCRYGYISDVEFDDSSGAIKKLIIPGPGKLFGIFGHEQEYLIPWDKVKQVGDDIILVDISPDKVLVDID